MICCRCGKEISLNEKQIKKREDLKLRIDLCPKCFRKTKEFIRENYPQSLFYLGTIFAPIPWNLYIENQDIFPFKSKMKVKLKCCKCGKQEIKGIVNIKNSKYTNNVPICNDCIYSYIGNLDEWKYVNSEAQKKVQCKDETKNKIKKFIKNLINNDPYFGLKRTFGKSNTLRGFYKGVYFASSFELSYLYEHRNQKISNCTFYAEYVKNNEIHYYYPDFFTDDFIIEVKGQKNSNDYSKKCLAGQKLAKQLNKQYIIYDINCISEYFYNEQSLNKIPLNELIITHAPNSWETTFPYYYKNKKWVQELLFSLKQNLNDKEKMIDSIQFYLIEKKLLKKFQCMNIEKCNKRFLKIISSPLFIIFYILNKIKEGKCYDL